MASVQHKRTGKEPYDPVIEAVRTRVAEVIKRHLGGQSERGTAISGLTVHGLTTPAEPVSFLYEPSFAFIARGSKRVMLGDEAYVYDETHFLLTAVGLPTVVQVLHASEAHPYYSIKMNIDLKMAGDLISEVDLFRTEAAPASTGMSIGPVTAPLAMSVMRLMDLLDTPQDIPILAPSMQREILYRVLTSSIGDRLRHAVQIGTQTNRVAAVVRFIQSNFAQPIRIDDLIRVAGMAESTLHHHFRAVTAMSPLQYQKHLRLHEARRLMLNDRMDAGSAAYKVGYESTTQFNREYRRLFGAPPSRDVKLILSKSLVSEPA
jgi:AraC-like DNA-binding protein